MRNALTLFALLVMSGTALPAAAQVLVLEGEYQGELQEADVDAFRTALETGLDRGAPGQITSADDTRAAIGDLATCSGGDCIVAIGFTVPASVAVRAEVYAEAEIYDFTIRIFDLAGGEVLATQTGDCTFCPLAEALDSFRFTAEAAISAVSPMPPPTAGPAPADEDPEDVAATAPESDAGWVPGEIRFNVSVVPDDATITVNGVEAGDGRASLDLAPQELQIAVAADGYEPYTEDVSLRPSMSGPIFLRVVMTPTAVDAVTVEAPRRTARSGPDFDRRAVGGVLMGTGAAALVGGIVLLALDGEPTCSDGPSNLCEDVWEFTAGGATATAIGAAAIGTGLGLFISTLGGDDADEVRSGSRLSFAPTRGGGAVFFERRF